MTPRPRIGLPVARIDALDALLARPAAPAPPPPPARVAATPDEPADPDAVLRDYVLAPYPPLADPRGGLAAVNLLVESFALAGVEAPGVALIERLRAQLGRGRVVWGVKHGGAALAWEFYVYDPGNQRAEATPAAVMAALDGVLAAPILPRPTMAPHMWSLAIDAATLAAGAAPTLTLYTCGADTPGASRSYTIDAHGAPTLANLYTFHDPRREPHAILARLAASVHLGGDRRGAAAVIEPGLQRCRRLCVANKRRADGLYFAGVDTDRTVQFLLRHHWPAPLTALLDSRRAAFAHLAWDLAVDVHAAPDGAPVLARTAIHATC